MIKSSKFFFHWTPPIRRSVTTPPNLTHRRLISEQTTIDSNISAKCHGPTERRDEGMDRHTKQIYVYNGRIKKISYSTKQRLNVIFKSPVSHLYSILSQSHSDNQCLNVDWVEIAEIDFILRNFKKITFILDWLRSTDGGFFFIFYCLFFSFQHA